MGMLQAVPAHLQLTPASFTAATDVVCVQSQAEKIAKNLESQLSDLTGKLDASARELADLNAFKSRSQAETAELARQLEEAEASAAQLGRLKQTLGKQLDEAKAALEDESRMRAKLTAENRNLQVAQFDVHSLVVGRLE